MILFIVLAILICFTFVIFFGAPYLPTLKQQQLIALQMLNLKPGQLLLEPGCGDARMLIAAAKKGINGIGYELNPIIYVIAKVVTWRYRRMIKIKFGNFWTKNWPKANGIYVFILPKFMAELDKKIIQSKLTNVKVVSYAFEIPDKKAISKKEALFLYKY